MQMPSLEQYFEPYRRQIVGHDQHFESPYGRQHIVYADWIASGRLYAPIEEALLDRFGPFVGNTHTETSVTGTSMTRGYHHAQKIIKHHVNAGPDDVVITACSGMTRVITKFQRILGLSIPEQAQRFVTVPGAEKPIVFITHMEHHSNHTSWLETIADVEWLPPDKRGLVDPAHLAEALDKHRDRKVKIGAFTACSNVTGICTPYYDLARLMHHAGGVCFVDFAASGPYVDIDMHPPDPEARLDAIYFSPHKFLGGPGSAAVLVFDAALYKNRVPDQPGGGTVNWTNPWGEHSYIQDIELREDGGTPAFLQTIKTALVIRLKEEMGTDKMLAREHELLRRALPALRRVPGLHLLADPIEDRLGILSFYVDDIHYNLIVRLLNDRFGIQVRGGCSCAGTYGHYLLHVTYDWSHQITDMIDQGDNSTKPGWVRLSLHPTMTDAELDYILDAIHQTVANIDAWSQDYTYDKASNEHLHRHGGDTVAAMIEPWFDLPAPVPQV